MTRVRIALAAIVVGMWVAGYVIAWTSHPRGQSPDELTGLMVIVLGWALGGEVARRWLRPPERDDEDAPKD